MDTDERLKNAHESGQALVPILFVVLILTAFAVTVATVARREIRASGGYLRESQAQVIARGAITYAMSELEQVTNGGSSPPQLAPPPDTDANGWSPLGDGWYKLEIVDTAARVNINTADANTLYKLPPLQQNPDIVAAIVDWRDKDETATSFQGAMGAESDYYQGLTPPYQAKNAPFDTVGELLLVRGITPALLYGSGASGVTSTTNNGMNMDRGVTRQAAATTPAVNIGTSTTPLAELVTTYSKELNVASDGTARVNVKTASTSDLQTKLGIPQNLATRLVNARNQGTQINSISDLLNVPGFTRQIMQQIGDKVSVADAQTRTNVININTAPVEAIAAIPGVTQQIFDAVTQARQGGTQFTGLNDVFQLTSLNRQQLQVLVDHICTKSSVYIVRVKVRVPGSRKMYCAEALVELPPPTSSSPAGSTAQTTTATTTLAPAKLLQWREVPREPGWSTWAPPPNYTTTGAMVGSH